MQCVHNCSASAMAGLAGDFVHTSPSTSSCHPVGQVYRTIARLLGCLTLFFLANVLKTLAAKLLATSFHTEAHFQKMQEALEKVSIEPCVCMSMRQRQAGQISMQPQHAAQLPPSAAHPWCSHARRLSLKGSREGDPCCAWHTSEAAVVTLSRVACHAHAPTCLQRQAGKMASIVQQPGI